MDGTEFGLSFAFVPEWIVADMLTTGRRSRHLLRVGLKRACASAFASLKLETDLPKQRTVALKLFCCPMKKNGVGADGQSKGGAM